MRLLPGRSIKKTLVTLLLMASVLVATPSPAHAILPTFDAANLAAGVQRGITNIFDWIEGVYHSGVAAIGTAADRAEFASIFSWEKLQSAGKAAMQSAWQRLIRVYAQQLAYDVGVWLGSGGKGQQPLFITEGWGAYLTNVADDAAGAFIEDFGNYMSVTNKLEAGSLNQKEQVKVAAYEANKEMLAEYTRQQSEYEDTGRQIDIDLQSQYADYQSGLEIGYAAVDDEFDQAFEVARNNPSLRNEQGFSSQGNSSALVRKLCFPSSPSAQLSITLGLPGRPESSPSSCRPSLIVKRWERAIRSVNFRRDLNDFIKPENNDLGIALSLNFQIDNQRAVEKEIAALKRLEGQGTKPVEGRDGTIKTPASSVRKTFEKSNIDTPQDVDTKWYGNDDWMGQLVINFFSGLFKGLMQRLKGGLAEGDSRSGSSLHIPDHLGSISNPNSDFAYLGVDGAKLLYQSIRQTRFQSNQNYNVLNHLEFCDQSYVGPNNCAIDTGLRQAITEGMRLVEAVEAGLIDPNKPFGFSAADTEPTIADGYPYRSLQILRKYRVVPVGWEIAAQTINQTGFNQQNQEAANSLAYLMDNYNDPDSPYYRLVDPNWILKIPEAYCKNQGFGPVTTQSVTPGVDSNNDGEYTGEKDKKPQVQVTRQADYCADDQQCVVENNDGTCRLFGYCTEEKRIWRLEGESCDPVYNSCQTVTTPAGSKLAFLKTTVDWDGCDASNAGCQWYSTFANLTQKPEALVGTFGVSTANDVIMDSNGRYAYVALFEKGLRVIDLNDPTNPVQVGSWTGTATAELAGLTHGLGLVQYGQHVVMNTPGGFVVINVANKGNPILVARYDAKAAWLSANSPDTEPPAASSLHLAIAGSNAFLAAGGMGLHVVDLNALGTNPDANGITNLQNPSIYENSEGGIRNQISRVVISGNRAYVLNITTRGLGASYVPTPPYYVQALDISNTSSIESRGTYAYNTVDNTTGFPRSLAVSGDVVYVGTQNDGIGGDTTPIVEGVVAIDFTNVSNPVAIGSFVTPEFGSSPDQWISDLEVSGNRLYLVDYDASSGRSALHSYDITNPVNPVVTESYDFSGAALSVGLGRDLVVVADASNGPRIFDLSAFTPEYQWVNSHNDRQYFDRDAAPCASGDEGCTQMIRLGAGLKTNLQPNSNFEMQGVTPNVIPGFSANSNYGATRGVTAASNLGREGLGVRFRAVGTDGPSPGVEINEYRRLTGGVITINPQPYKRYFLASADVLRPELNSDGQPNTITGTWYLWLHNSNEGCKNNPITGCENNFVALWDQSNQTFADALATPPVVPPVNEWKRIWFIIESQPNNTWLSWSFGTDPSHLSTGEVVIDNAQVMEILPGQVLGNNGSVNHSNYQTQNVVHYKTAPDHYACYDDTTGAVNLTPETTEDINTANDDVAQCSRFSAVCSAEEVGCRNYDPVNGDPSVPGVVGPSDFCPAECVGYDTFYQSETQFADSIYSHFIPTTADSCSANYAGCEQFTNLDTVEQGGEGTEYFTGLRQCVKPDDTTVTYFIWEGSDELGYRLQPYVLKQSNANSSPCTNIRYYPSAQPLPGQPDLSGTHYCADPDGGSIPGNVNNPQDNDGACYPPLLARSETEDDATYIGRVTAYWQPFGIPAPTSASYPINNASLNSDCRSFYDQNGSISYRLLSATVSGFNDCHPYRRTEQGSQTECVNHGGHYNNLNECVYWGIPRNQDRPEPEYLLTVSCPADANLCREYKGDTSNNIQQLFIDDFENASASGYSAGTISSNSTYPGGHSLVVENQNSLTRSLCADGSCVVEQGKTYRLSVWARVDSYTGRPVSVAFTNATATEAERFTYNPRSGRDEGMVLTPQWQLFDLGPVNITNPVDAAMALQFTNLTGTVYLDNLKLDEVRDFVYAIKNSWETPISCDNPLDNAEGLVGEVLGNRTLPQAMVGCRAYRTDQGDQVTLRTFDHLCRPQAVGCEAVYLTHNSDSPFSQDFNLANNTNNILGLPDLDPSAVSDDVSVPADSLAYIVLNERYQCDSAAQGCSAFGLPRVDRQNDTDVDFTLREDNAFSTVYIKNEPDSYDDILCSRDVLWCQEYQPDYRSPVSAGDGAFYFKDPGNRVCEYRQVPPGNTENITGWFKLGSTNLDPDCPFTQSPYDTVGLSGAPVRQPDGNSYRGWTGVCPLEQSSCTEYIEPTASIGKNVLPNGNFEVNVTSAADNWYSQIGAVPATPVTSATIIDSQPIFDVNEAGNAVGKVVPNGNLLNVANVRLKANTLYTISFYVRNNSFASGGLRFGVACGDVDGLDCINDTLVSPDNSMSVVQSTAAAQAANTWNVHDPMVIGYYLSNDSDAATPAANYPSDPSALELVEGWHFVSARFYVGSNPSPMRIFFDNFDSLNLGDSEMVVDNVVVAETPIAYGKDETLDHESCNGIGVDPSQGCLLLNNRSAWAEVGSRYGIIGTNRFSADRSPSNLDENLPAVTPQTYPSGSGIGICDPQRHVCLGCRGTLQACTSDTDCPASADSTELLKVKLDRTCDSWLACKTQTSVGADTYGVDQLCLDIGLCNSVDEFGKCNSFVTSQTDDSHFTPNTVDGLRNLTGYSLPSYAVDQNSLTPGYYPFDIMNQVGESSEVVNGGFEYVGSGSSRPIGWRPPSTTSSWSKNYFSVIDTVSRSQRSQISPYEGRGLLRVNGEYGASSESVDVQAGTTYYLTFALNTTDLRPANANARVVVTKRFPNNPTYAIGNNPEPSKGFLDDNVIAIYPVPAGVPWQKYTLPFTTDATTTELYITLHNDLYTATDANTDGIPDVKKVLTAVDLPCDDSNNDNSCDITGTSFFDSIELQPILSSGDKIINGQLNFIGDHRDLYVVNQNNDAVDGQYLSRSCRVYPNQNAQQCSYIDPNAVTQQGQYGYCMAHDRFPGNPENCIQWWPIDAIEGQPLENLLPYDDRLPIYYCLEGTMNVSANDVVEARNKNPDRTWVQVMEDIELAPSHNSGGSDLYDVHVLEATDDAKQYRPDAICLIGAHGFRTADNPGDDPISLFTSFPLLADIRQDFPGREDPNTGEDDFTTIDVCMYVDNFLRVNTGGDNGFSFYVQFDENGAIKNYVIVNFDDNDGNDPQYFYADAIYYVFSYCPNLVQTVSGIGQGKPWYSRIQPGSTYMVPDLNYVYDGGYTKDNYPPFGAAVAPKPADYGPSWELRNAKGIKLPLYLETPNYSQEPPYQARGGSAFGCNIGKVGCDSYALLTHYSLPRITRTTLSWSIDHVKRLFARSFNFLSFRDDTSDPLATHYNITSNVCVGGDRDGSYCINDADCPETNFQTSCTAAKVCRGANGAVKEFNGSQGVPYTCNTDADCYIQDECIVFPRLDEGSNQYFCRFGGNECGPCPEGSKTCVSNDCGAPAVQLQCMGQCQSADPEYPLNGSSCISNDDCSVGAACLVNWREPGSETLSVDLNSPNEQWCPINTRPVGKCNGGSNDGSVCTSDVVCGVGASCMISNLGQCSGGINANEVCASNADCSGGSCIIPTYDVNNPSSPTDYCGVSPQIHDIKLNNSTGISGAAFNEGSVELKFNVQADPDQLPMATINISWGDGEVTTVSGGKLRERTDPSQPFVFQHTYSYDQMSRLIGSELGNVPLSVPLNHTVRRENQSIRATIAIQVIDNWGWCTLDMRCDVDNDGAELTEPACYEFDINGSTASTCGSGICRVFRGNYGPDCTNINNNQVYTRTGEFIITNPYAQ